MTIWTTTDVNQYQMLQIKENKSEMFYVGITQSALNRFSFQFLLSHIKLKPPRRLPVGPAVKPDPATHTS